MPYKDPIKAKEYQREYQKRYRKSKRLDHAAIKLEAKQAGCSNCPENDPVCLDFHHLDPSIKLFEPSMSVHYGASEELLRKELDKCVILCANCHRKAHG